MSSAAAAPCWAKCSRSSTTSTARSTPRARPARRDALLQGVDLVHQQFLAKLESFGVTRVDALGLPFDPAAHEAVTIVPVTDPARDHVVVGIVKHGYAVGDEVLRPAQVAVGQLA